jgi:hypothetical protein
MAVGVRFAFGCAVQHIVAAELNTISAHRLESVAQSLQQWLPGMTRKRK